MVIALFSLISLSDVFTLISAPFFCAWCAICLSNSRLLITETFCFFASIVIFLPPGALTSARVIWLSNVLPDGIIPISSRPDVLTRPPQCSGVPISKSSSITSTLCPLAATSLAQKRPAMLPPATTTS